MDASGLCGFDSRSRSGVSVTFCAGAGRRDFGLHDDLLLLHRLLLQLVRAVAGQPIIEASTIN
jgi:hypothetical protein